MIYIFFVVKKYVFFKKIEMNSQINNRIKQKTEQ